MDSGVYNRRCLGCAKGYLYWSSCLPGAFCQMLRIAPTQIAEIFRLLLRPVRWSTLEVIDYISGDSSTRRREWLLPYSILDSEVMPSPGLDLFPKLPSTQRPARTTVLAWDTATQDRCHARPSDGEGASDPD